MTSSEAGEPQGGRSPEYLFELRRVGNWLPLGLMYAAFYMSRYNFTVTNPALCKEYGWSNEQIGWVISLSLAVYGFSVFFNGPLADKIGGKKSILIGSVGALVFNLLFAAGAFFGVLSWDVAPWATLLTYLTVVWAINMYFQSFGALSVVKVNAAWFPIQERGIFAGLFGAMIQFGRILAVPVGGVILASSSWVWVHIIPSIVLATIAILTLLFVRNTPEEIGFPRQVEDDDDSGEEKPTLLSIVKKIFTNPTMWIITLAMMSTGLIRHTLEQWAPKYFMDVHHAASDSLVFILAFAGQVMIGIFGAFVMGNVSDRYFGSRRGPVTAIAYAMQALIMAAFGLLHPGPWTAAILLMVFYFFLNGCHGLIAGTASMDFGGRKAAATAAGLLDGSQYLVGSFAGVVMGKMLDKFGWDAWSWSIIPFTLLAAGLMASRWNALPKKPSKPVEPKPCPACGAPYLPSVDACPQCGEPNRAKLLQRVVIMAKESFNTGIFALMMFAFPLVILLSKVLGGIVKPETRSAATTAVLLFCFLGILVGWLALTRVKAAREKIAAAKVGEVYLEIVQPAQVMGWAAFGASIIAAGLGIWFLLGAL